MLALKGNQGALRDDVEVFAAEQKAKDFKDAKVTRHETVDGDHGRIETRTYTAIHDVDWLKERHDWPGLQGVVMVESAREIEGRIERETRFFITSLAWLACQLGPVIRSHWAIENSLHWVMDMVFRDDECRIRTDHAPANFTTLKHMAHNIVRKAPGKDFTAPQTQSGRLGRRLPRQPPRRINPSPDSPGRTAHTRLRERLLEQRLQTRRAPPR